MLLSFWTLTKQKLKCVLIKILKAKVHSVIFERVQRISRGVVFLLVADIFQSVSVFPL